MSMASNTLILEHDDRESEVLSLHGGQVVVFSKCGPDKTVNEDGAAVLPHALGGVLAVADGMGGLNAGERAARAISTVHDSSLVC